MKKVLLSLLLLILPFIAAAQVYSVVEEYVTDVRYISKTEMVCKERRVITVLDKRGLSAANLLISLNKGHSTLGRFSGSMTDSQGTLLRKIKKSDLEYTEYSEMLADDACSYFYTCEPPHYPFTVTYEWEEKHSNGIAWLPAFVPQGSSNQQVHKARYHIEASPGLDFRYKLFNASANVVESIGDKGGRVLDICMDCLPALYAEPLSPASYEILPHAYIAPATFVFGGYNGSYESWAAYGSWLFSLMEGRGVLPQNVVAELRQKTASCSTLREKVQVVCDILAATTRYVSIQLGVGGMQPAPAAEVCRTGYGDCKALVNYARAMLGELGIESNYVVINTDRENITRDFVNGSQFNHAILQVPLDGDTLWVECTNPTLPLGYLHDGIAGHDALVVTAMGGKLCRLPSYAHSQNVLQNNVAIALANDGSATVGMQRECSGAKYEGLRFFSKLTKVEQRDYLRSCLNMLNAEVTAISYNENREGVPSCAVTCLATVARYATKSGNRFFVPLNPLKGVSQLPAGDDRRTDVVIKSGAVYVDNVEIVLPDGFMVESLLQPVNISSSIASFEVDAVQEGNVIRISQKLSFNKGRYSKELYAELRSVVKALYDVSASKIVVRKQ